MSTCCCCRGPRLCYQHPRNFSSRGSSTIHTLLSIFSFKWCTETYQSTQVLSHRYANTCTRAHKPNWKKKSELPHLTWHSYTSFSLLQCCVCVHLLITSLPCHLASLERRLCKHSELKPTFFRLHLPSCCWNSVWIHWPFNQEVLNIQVFQAIRRYQDDSRYS